MEWTIYHNPRCSKSRQTLELLKAEGVEPKVVEYIKEGLTQGELDLIKKALGKPVSQFIRTKEEVFKSSGVGLNDEEVLEKLLLDHPILLERPIVLKGSQAVMGRPPENIRSLF